MRLDSFIASILASTCDQGRAVECQFSAVTQCTATKYVWIRFSQGAGISGIEVKHRHICIVRVIKRPAIVDAFEAAFCQMGLRSLQL